MESASSIMAITATEDGTYVDRMWLKRNERIGAAQ